MQFLYGAGDPDAYEAGEWGEGLSVSLQPDGEGGPKEAGEEGEAGAASGAGVPAAHVTGKIEGRSMQSVKRGVSRAHYKLSEAMLRFGLLPSVGRSFLLPGNKAGDPEAGPGRCDSECIFDPSSPVPPILQLADRLPVLAAGGQGGGPVWGAVAVAGCASGPVQMPGPR